MNPPLVIYHASCTDGFCAAWLFHKVFPDAEFIPAQYGHNSFHDAFSEASPIDKDIYIVDFSFPRENLLYLNAHATSLVVLDHHRTAEQDLKDLDFCTFDMNKSGGRLAYEYLKDRFPNSFPDNPRVQFLVDLTEDRDLWRFKIPNSKVINSAIRSYPFEFDAWDSLSLKNPDTLVNDGHAIERYRKQQIGVHVSHAKEINLAGYEVRAVCCTVGEFISEVAEELAEDRPFGVVYFDTEDSRAFSLRSKEGGEDVSEIAKRFGGGGHARAAGFKMPRM